MEDGKINNPRAEIDRIDAELLRLLNRRAEIALQVGAAKRSRDVSLCDHDREREVLERLIGLNDGPLAAQNIRNIFQRIMDECLQAQQSAFHAATDSDEAVGEKFTGLAADARVAFQGESGTIGEKAVFALMGETCQPVPRPTVEALFTALIDGKADCILAPLENSLTGSIHQCYDLLLESDLCIRAEIIYPVADHNENYTRFALLAPHKGEATEGSKISLVVCLPHRPGALHDALRAFVRRNIDLLKIESHPIKERPWQYNFYLDLQAPASESELRGALDEIEERAENVRFLGRYSSVEILSG